MKIFAYNNKNERERIIVEYERFLRCSRNICVFKPSLVTYFYQFLLQETVSSFFSFNQQFFIDIPTIIRSLC